MQEHLAINKRYLSLGAYVCCILLITLVFRESGLVPQLQPVPLWSLAEWFRGSLDSGISIILNILLFVPFGYLLTGLDSQKKLRPILLSFSLSLLIELLQYVTCRGVFDVDDLLTNTLGGLIGEMIFLAFRKALGLKFAGAVWIRYALVAVGIFGCLLNAKMMADSPGTVYERQFGFTVDEVSLDGGNLHMTGTCALTQGATPPYTLLLKEDTGEEAVLAEDLQREFPLQTELSGDRFTAEAPAISADRKYEICVVFGRRKPIGTRVYLHGDALEYVPGKLPERPLWLPEGAVLKAVNDEHGVHIYQDGSSLIWVISKEIPEDTELLCHLSTNEPEKLPENRRASRFDNIGFMAELASKDGCRIFSAALPAEYRITSIRTGYAQHGMVQWEENFRPDSIF